MTWRLGWGWAAGKGHRIHFESIFTLQGVCMCECAYFKTNKWKKTTTGGLRGLWVTLCQ